MFELDLLEILNGYDMVTVSDEYIMLVKYRRDGPKNKYNNMGNISKDPSVIFSHKNEPK